MDEEYLNELTVDEKNIFMEMFCKLIKADNITDDSEIDFLTFAGKRYGIASEQIVSMIQNINNIDYISEAKRITNRQHALELIKELCVLANADENLDNSELSLIVNIAEAMGIEDNKIIVINRWVLDSIILQKAGRMIMEKNHE